MKFDKIYWAKGTLCRALIFNHSDCCLGYYLPPPPIFFLFHLCSCLKNSLAPYVIVHVWLFFLNLESGIKCCTARCPIACFTNWFSKEIGMDLIFSTAYINPQLMPRSVHVSYLSSCFSSCYNTCF